MEALHELERFFPLVKEPHYRAAAGAELAALNAYVGRFDRAHEVLETALEASRKNKITQMTQHLEELRRKIFVT